MKTINDFDNYQEFVDYIKINEVDTYNDLLDYINDLNDDTETTYTINDVVEDSELFYRWYEML